MAIEYGLYLETPIPAILIAEELARLISDDSGVGDGSIDQQILDPGFQTMQGLWIRVIPGSPPAWHPVVTDLGITPTARAAYRIDKFEDSERQTERVIGLTAALLDAVAGDAALTRDLEQVWLLRKGGVLYLNERDDLWTPSRISLVSSPYQRLTYTFSNE